MLLLPDVPEAEQTAALILQGVTPEVWPESLRYELDSPATRGRAAALVDGDDFVSRYNRAVLIGARGVWEGLPIRRRGELRCTGGHGSLLGGSDERAAER